jgi:hypothetical protein
MNPNDYVGMTVIVTPNVNDIFHGYISNEFRGTVIGIKDGFFQVKDKDDNIYDVEEADMEFLLDLAE